MNAIDPGARVRVVVLAGISLLVLGNATTWSPPRLLAWKPRQPSLTLDLTVESQGRTLPVQGPLRFGQYLHVAGRAPQRCHLFVVAIARFGPPRGLLTGNAGDPGNAVGPGPYRVRASYDLSQSFGPVRIWAVCGSAELSYAEVENAAFGAYQDAGGGEDGVRKGKVLEGLPEGTLVASEVIEHSP
jgi:hypothetical protein